jgi:hypothetical protein
MENRDVNKLLLAALIKWVRKAGRRGRPWRTWRVARPT